MQAQNNETGLLNKKVFSLWSIFKKSLWFAWHFHRKLLISLLLAFSIIFLSLRLLAFYLEEHPHIIHHFIDSQLSVVVAFDKLSIDINLFSPVISMQNFRIVDASDSNEKEVSPLIFKSAKIRLNTIRSLTSGQFKIDTIAVSGVSLAVQRNKNNELFIADFQLNKQGNKKNSGNSIEKYLQLFNQTTFTMKNSELYFTDDTSVFPSLFLSDINLQIKNRDARHQISLLATLNKSDTQIDLRFDFSGAIHKLKKWDGKIYCAINDLNQNTLLQLFQQKQLQIEHLKLNKMQADTKFWSNIKQGSLQSIFGEFALYNVKLAHVGAKKKMSFDKVSSNFKLVRSSKKNIESKKNAETVWTLDLFDFITDAYGKKITEKDIKAKIYKNDARGLSHIQLFLNHLDLEEVSPMLAFFSPDELNNQLYKIVKPKGQLSNIIALLHLESLQAPINIKHYQVQADINGFAINALYSIPKIRNFSSRIILNEKRGRAFINSSDMNLHLKSLFRDSWPVSRLSGEFFWQREGKQWFFGAEQLQLKNPHLSAEANINLWLSEDYQLFMDLSGFFYDADVKNVPYYLPAKIMSEGLVDWLDNAFVSGQGTDGGVLFRGNLAQFPFDNHSGVLDITFNTRDVLLNYNKGWPLLSDINAQVQFTERGMGVESQQSKIFSSSSHNIEAHIESYSDSILKLTGDIDSTIADGLHFLKQTQLASNDVVQILDGEGDIDLNLDVSISLDEGQTDSKVSVKLKDVDYYPPGFARKKDLVSHINGAVLIHNKLINSQKLTADIMGYKAKIAIKTDRKNKRSNDSPKVSVNIASQVSMQKLKEFSLIPELLMPLSKYLSKPTRLNLALDLPDSQRGLSFNIRSDLQSLKSDLPPPFNKLSGKKSPFSLSFSELKAAKKTSASQLARLDIKVSDIMSMALVLNTENEQFELLKGNIAFKGAKAKLPKKNILRISGSLDYLPLAQWQSILGKQGRKQKNKKQVLNASAVKPFTIPVELAMQRLVLPEFKYGSKTGNSNTVKVNKHAEADKPKPSNFPLINGYIESLKMADFDLGRLILKTHRGKNAIIFDQIKIDGLLLILTAKGKWHYTNKASQVDINTIITTPSVGKLLKALGNDQTIHDGKTQLTGNLSWPGGLMDISKAAVSGNFHIISQKGVFVDGEAGTAGRLLGLLNMNALARRLSFDFNDFSAKGFEFEKIEGKGHLNKGMFIIDDFLIIAPSAKIYITGTTDLLTERFDQRAIVIPEISATLPLAGAAVAGPVGAVAVWVGQRLLGDELNKITAYGYTIKGNWDKPEIKKTRVNNNDLNKIKKIFPTKITRATENKSVNKKYNNPVFDSL